jgi:phage N-6-adenine-methyltransferase
MKMNNRGSTIDTFETPDFLFQELNHRFAFDVDAACTSQNKKLANGFTVDLGINGLKVSWGGLRVFCNPPFSDKAAWINKAHEEVQNNNCPLVVMILPTNSMSASFWDDVIYPNYKFDVLRGRVQYIHPITKKPAAGNNSGTTVVYFWKKPGSKKATA